MARFKFGRPISLRWNGLLVEGPAETVFEIPDEYYEEFNEDVGGVEPTLVWLDSDEGATLRARVTVLEGSVAPALSDSNPLALGTAAPGVLTQGSRGDHVHPTTGWALSGHNHAGVYDPAGTAATAVSAHEAASDPHPVYLTDAEGDAQYSQLGHNHAGVYDPAGTAASEVASHVAAADPHSIYLTDAEGDAQYSQLGHTHAAGEASFTTVLKQYVKNTSGASIAKGKAVYVSGADGTNVTVALADYDSDATSSKTLGLMETTVANNGFGYVVTEGILTGFDTTAASTEGVPVWLGDNGALVYGTAPSEPHHTVYIGVVSRKNVSNGEVFIKVQNGYELNELHDVVAPTPADNDIIQYDNASGYWKNETLANAGIAASGHAHAGVYDPAGTAASAISTHEAAADPHPTYLTSAEGDAAYATTGHAHSYVTSATGTTNQVNVSASTGAVTFSLPQSIATTSNVTFNQVTASDYVKLSNWNQAGDGLSGTADNVTVSSAGTYYAIGGANCEVSFTPDFVGQKFFITMTGYVSLNTTTVQYAFVRVTLTDSSNTLISSLGFGRSDNFGTSGRGSTVAWNAVWEADTTSTRKIKLYGTTQTTNGLVLTLSYWQLNVMALA